MDPSVGDVSGGRVYACELGPGMVEALTTEQTPPEVPPVIDASKLLRIGTMIRELLAEARRAPLDDGGRDELKEIYTRSINELREVLSPELRSELDDLTVPLDAEAPTDSELLIAQAQIVGWLEGLFHGIQATLFTQQMQAQQQFEEMRQPRALQGGREMPQQPGAYL